MMCQSIFVHQTYGRCWCSQSKRDALLFFSDSGGLAFYVFNQPSKTTHKHPPNMFHLMCNVRHWFAGNQWTSGRPPTQMFNPRRWFSLFTLPNHVKPNLCLRFPWVFGRKFVTMLVTLCLFCCIHCFWTPEKTEMQCCMLCWAIVMVKIPEY